MRVLIVCSGTYENSIYEKRKPFIHEQMNALKKYGVEFDIFLIKKKGIFGYLQSRKILLEKINSLHFDLIHAHYGLAGMLAVLQRQLPVVITFIGSDINNFGSRIVSIIATLFSFHNIFVSKKLLDIAGVTKNCSIIPYGIDFDEVIPIDKNVARKYLNISKVAKICLFGSSRHRLVKNYPLAKEAVSLLKNIILLDLNGNYSKEEVIYMINASDCIVLTSFSEGSPQIIKEAMACNVPIVTTDVGDVRMLINDTNGCYITSYNPKDVADNIKRAISFGKRTKGRENLKSYDNVQIAMKIFDIYQKAITKND